MFEDIKKDLKDTINECVKKCDNYEKELGELDTGLLKLLDFEEIKANYRISSIYSIASVIALGIITANIMTYGFSFLAFVGGGLAIISACVNWNKRTECKKILVSDYSGYLDVPNIELTKKEEALSKNIEIIENNLKETKEHLEKLKDVSEMIKDYEGKELSKYKDTYLNDFLNEKVDYTNIHFDSSIDGEIDYKERPKQFIKKGSKF